MQEVTLICVSYRYELSHAFLTDWIISKHITGKVTLRDSLSLEGRMGDEVNWDHWSFIHYLCNNTGTNMSLTFESSLN